MRRERLRPVRPEGELAFYEDRYPSGYRHDGWPDHVERIAASADFLRPLIKDFHIETLADLSCGDGALAKRLGLTGAILGDLVDGDHLDIVGSLPDTLDLLTPGASQLFLCSETIEHMDDPDNLLSEARLAFQYLFVSTPVDEHEDTGNAEHYWGWDTEAVDFMLREAGWVPEKHEIFTPKSADTYRFQFWFAW
jgi:hypothetical protein